MGKSSSSMWTLRSWFGDTTKDVSLDTVRSMTLIFVIALTLRVVVALWLPPEIVWLDGYRYERVADNLLEGRGFGSLADNWLSVPTQPLLIAAAKLIFGSSYVALRLFFCLIGAATCVLGYALAKRLFTSRIALLSGILLATYPFYVYLSALFEYPQTFFIFIVALAFVLLYEFLDSSRLVILFLSGVAFGVGVLTVPTALIFLPFLPLVLRSPKSNNWPARVGIVVAAVSIPVGLWTVRNVLAYGEPILINKAAGENLWVANNETYYLFGKAAVIPACAVGYTDTDYCKDTQALDRTLRQRELSEEEFIAAHEKASWDNGIEFIRNNPVSFAYLTVRKFFEFWGPDPNAVTRGRAQGGPYRVWLARLSYLPILALGAVGLALSFVRNRSRSLPILYFVFAFSLPYYIFLPTTRYRLPIDLFLIIFASFAIDSFRIVHFSSAVSSLTSRSRGVS